MTNKIKVIKAKINILFKLLRLITKVTKINIINLLFNVIESIQKILVFSAQKLHLMLNNHSSIFFPIKKIIV
jgi:hypothetical protein